MPFGDYDPYKPRETSNDEKYIAHQKTMATLIVCATIILITIIIVVGVVLIINKRK